MSSATATIAGFGRPVVRETVWNWDVILVIMSCLLFWAAVIVGVVVL
jgi:hypothetical protein